MAKLQNNNDGFTVIEFLLVILVFIAIGLVAYFAVNHAGKQPTSNISSQHTQVAQKPTPKVVNPVVDPTANWQTVKGSDGTFSVKIPQSWVSLTCQQFGGSGPNLYIASSQTYLAKCNTDYLGEADFYAQSDQSASQAPTKGATDQSFSTQQVIVNGVSGYKTTNLTSASDALTPNTTYTTYSFYSKNMSFYARYQQITNAPNDLSAFDQVVQTWKF